MRKSVSFKITFILLLQKVVILQKKRFLFEKVVIFQIKFLFFLKTVVIFLKKNEFYNDFYKTLFFWIILKSRYFSENSYFIQKFVFLSNKISKKIKIPNNSHQSKFYLPKYRLSLPLKHSDNRYSKCSLLRKHEKLGGEKKIADLLIPLLAEGETICVGSRNAPKFMMKANKYRRLFSPPERSLKLKCSRMCFPGSFAGAKNQ